MKPAEVMERDNETLRERLTGPSASLGIDELDYFLYALQLGTMLGRKRDSEFLGDQFREGNEIRRGNAGLHVRLKFRSSGRSIGLPSTSRFADEISETICGCGHG